MRNMNYVTLSGLKSNQKKKKNNETHDTINYKSFSSFRANNIHASQ